VALLLRSAEIQPVFEDLLSAVSNCTPPKTTPAVPYSEVGCEHTL